MSKLQRHFVLLALTLLAAGCGNSSRESEQVSRDPRLRFLSPEAATEVSGTANMLIESDIDEPLSSITLAVDGQVVTAFDSVPQSLQLDTTRFGNGPRELVLQATADSGARYSDSLNLQVDNPRHRLLSSTLDRSSYGPTDLIVVELEYDSDALNLAADFGTLDDDYSENRISIDERGGGSFRVSYRPSADNSQGPGLYSALLHSTNEGGDTLVSEVPIQLLAASKLPLVVSAPGAVFSPTPPQVLEGIPNAPRLTTFELPPRLIEGAASELSVSWSSTAENPAERIVLSSPERSGAWVIPVPNQAPSGTLEMPIEISSFTDDFAVTTLPLDLTVLGADGSTTETIQQSIDFITTSIAGVRIVLNWSGTSDLDLGVTTPDGSHIDYTHRSAQGGKLEHDSNSMCRGDVIPTESVSWIPTAVVPGNYGIDVSQFDPCGQVGVDYTVTVIACGQAQTINGSFAPEEASSTSTHELPPFAVDCLRRLSGRVTYAKLTPEGISNAPAAEVRLQLKDLSDGRIHELRTDSEGHYGIQFDAGLTPNIEATVFASWTLPGQDAPRAQVINLDPDANELHSARFKLGTLESDHEQKDLIIMGAADSGAFNILSVMRRAFQWVHGTLNSYTTTRIPNLSARWEQGRDTPKVPGSTAAPPHGSYYWCYSAGNCRRWAIWISSEQTKAAEFADSVLAHEFFHHFARHLGAASSVGGAHSFRKRTVAALAWSEGQATALGQHVLGHALYRSGNSTAHSTTNIETTAGYHSAEGAYGTDPESDMAGDLNELLVAAVLWDLLDVDNGEAEGDDDRIKRGREAVTRAFTVDPRLPNWTDREAEGRDLVDFLDRWACHDRGIAAQTGQASQFGELEALLASRRFHYESPTPMCR